MYVYVSVPRGVCSTCNEAMCVNAAARVASRAVVVRRRQIRVVVSAIMVVCAVWTRMDGLCASVRHSIPDRDAIPVCTIAKAISAARTHVCRLTWATVNC